MSAVWRAKPNETVLRLRYRGAPKGGCPGRFNLSRSERRQFVAMRQEPENRTPNILREIQSNKVKPVYLLCGEESFLIEGTLKQMLDTLLTPDTRDFNISFLDGTAVTTREILSHVDLYPVLSKRRVVVVRAPQFFKSQKRAAPITLIRNAVKLENAAAEKCIVTMAKLLEVTPHQLAERHIDFTNAVDAVLEDVGDKLTADERAFLERLPQIAENVDVSSMDAGAADDAELLLEWLQGELPKTSVLILIVQGAVNERNRIVKQIREVGRYVAFQAFSGAASGGNVNRDPLYKKVCEKFAEFEKEITHRAYQQLRTRTGGDMHTIAEAINKIVNFVGDKRQIDEQDVRNMVTQNTFDSIFDLTDAIGRRSVSQALKSLHEVLASGEPHIKVHTLIIRQLRLALQAKLVLAKGNRKQVRRRMPFSTFVKDVFKPISQEMADFLPTAPDTNVLKQRPYAAYKIFQTLHAFTVDELMAALQKALEVDTQLKTTQLDATCILEQLVCELCEKPGDRRHF